MNLILRLLLTALHSLLKLNWSVRRPRTFGAHALALTPEGKVILVKLRYAPGWRLPGGGRGEHEDPRDAVLRELREEIGLISHGDVQLTPSSRKPPTSSATSPRCSWSATSATGRAGHGKSSK